MTSYCECHKCGQYSWNIGRGACYLCEEKEFEIYCDSDITSPEHYKEEGKIECIDYMRERLTPEQFKGYLNGNVIKYLHRYRYKGSPTKDLKKAQVYLGWLIEEQDDG